MEKSAVDQGIQFKCDEQNTILTYHGIAEKSSSVKSHNAQV